MTTVTILAAMDQNRGIGKNGLLPWRQKTDLINFSTRTKGKWVVFGRVTWENIKYLPDRKVIAISSRFVVNAELIVPSFQDAIGFATAHNIDELFVCGGGKIYQEVINIAKKMYLTVIDNKYDCDVFFPEFDMGKWREVGRRSYPKGDIDDNSFTEYELVRAKR